MVNLLTVAPLALGASLIALVLLQKTNTDASGAFSSDSTPGGILEKRGAEKTLYRTTILIAFLFVASLIAHLFVK